ncbi:hypothetical protein EMPS_10901 [Entomortierella parvispora]|uniref:Uncharacterized protein n=1 Tax=Entomortierella parvispora TaxID=205924 RepID=A0A9P3HLS4_9FUNG|nr:hypothetical protein EMPS_10901 [Entomortierella parvispora]
MVHPQKKKSTTQQHREAKRIKALAKAGACLDDMEAIVKFGKKLKKQQHRKLDRLIGATFYFKQEFRRSLAQYLQSQGWTVVECISEADIAIAQDCTKPVLQLLAWSLVTTTLRIYLDWACTRILISSNHWKKSPALAIDVRTMVNAYMDHEDVVCKQSSAAHFDSALKVFSLQEFTLPTPAVLLQLPCENGGVHQADASLTHESVLQRRKNLHLRLSEVEVESRLTSSNLVREGPPAFNRYSTVDRAPLEPPPPHASGRKYKYRQRYAIKTRSRMTEHDPPRLMKQHKWIPWTAPPASPWELEVKPPSQKPKTPDPPLASKASGASGVPDTPKPPPKPISEMEKFELVNRLEREHPTRTLSVGTINANMKRAWSKKKLCDNDGKSIDLRPRMKWHLQKVVKLSYDLKITCERAIGIFLESLSVADESEKLIMSCLCLPFTTSETVTGELQDANGEIVKAMEHDSKLERRNGPVRFFLSLLTAMHSGTRPATTSKYGKAVCLFMDKAGDNLTLPDNSMRILYPASSFVRTSAVQLCAQYSRHFKQGTIELCKQIRFKKERGLLPADTVDRIDCKLTAAENFMIMNKITGSRRCLTPMSTFDSGFITLSEPDLVALLWNDLPFRQQLQQYAKVDYPSTYLPAISQLDVVNWLGGISPGVLINKWLTDIGGYSAIKRKKLRNFSRSTLRMSVDGMREHLLSFQHEDFNPVKNPGSYTAKGYLLRGSIRTDGFLLQLLAFKLNELHCVKYRRLQEDRLPARLTSTLGGTDHYLTEVRNVIKSEEDVQRLWGCHPSQIKVLGIDLGQAFVVGASALLPSSRPANVFGKKRTCRGT